jgi:predicted dehydrogenase
MNLTPEEKEVGRENYFDAVGHTRRDFLKNMMVTGAVSGAGLGAAYFGYQGVSDPVRVGMIGTGDEGGVLIGAINPDYLQVTAIADIRPYSIHRAFHGDHASPGAIEARPGLIKQYGWNSVEEAKKQVNVYTDDYHDLLDDDSVDAVIIALPLHLHAQVACEALMRGKHVLTEKLMAHNVAQCKVMSRLAADTGLLLATGHQRHYSVLYDNAVNLIRYGLLGEIHHIRAQWHRGNLPGRDSWQQPLPGGEIPVAGGERVDPIAERIAKWEKELPRQKNPEAFELMKHRLAQWKAWDSDRTMDPAGYGYRDFELDGRSHSAMEELCRWRLWERTGGGLMAELGSHQMDAASIFISALRRDGKKAKPLTIHAVGGRHVFPQDRQAEDHVYCMLEFPGPGYEEKFDVGYKDLVNNVPSSTGIPDYSQDSNKKIVVTYSSIMGNGFGGYGEIVMGTKGTLILEREKEAMLFQGSSTSTRVGVKGDAGGATLDTQASGEDGPAAKVAETGPVSRGYREEMEHWAYCIKNDDPENRPRCRPEVALGDAVIALSANTAIKKSLKGGSGYLEFDDGWFDIDNDATPDGSIVAKEKEALLKNKA